MAKHGTADFRECWYGRGPNGRPCRYAVVGAKALLEASGVCPKCGAPLPKPRPNLSVVQNKGVR